jgi:uncharacterized protein (TIGR02246 family)
MRVIATGFFLVSALISLAAPVRAEAPAAVTPAQEAAIEAGIKTLSGEWSTAYLKNDPAILERIWAPDFVYVEASGHRFTKAEGIASLKAAAGEQHSVSEASSIDVRIYGGGTVAVDIGDYLEKGRDKGGKAFERKTRFTNVWVLRDGKWQCVSGHASLIPAGN